MDSLSHSNVWNTILKLFLKHPVENMDGSMSCNPVGLHGLLQG
jgi:hypothetical protein